MNTETKILLVRFGAAVVLIGLFALSWWMDYRWKKSPKKDLTGR